jgi:tetratricopeptide (TPR) repeat protein
MKRRDVPAGACLALLVIAVFAPTLMHGFVWDDDVNVVDNPNLRTASGLLRIWLDPSASQQYYPLTHTTFWIQYQAGGLRAWPYHAVNVLLHATAAVLLWLILRKLSIPGAWFAAAVFAIHPLQTESLAWVTERKNVLAAVFFFAAILLYLGRVLRESRSDESDIESEADGPTVVWAAVLVFFLALLAKTAVATASVAMLAILWWKHPSLRRRDLVGLAPFFVLGLVMGLVTAWLEIRHVGAQGDAWSMTATERVLVAGRTTWFYLGKLFWPSGQVFIYPRWQLDVRSPVQWLFPLAVVGAVVTLLLLRKRLGRGPIAAAIVYGALLAPASGFFSLYFFRYSFVQDHFQYFACVAPIALTTAIVYRLLPSPVARRGLALAALVVLGVLTVQRSAVFRDEEALYLDTLKRNPDAVMATYNLGLLRAEQGRLDEAIALYESTSKAMPTFAPAHLSLGLAYEMKGDISAALREYREALRLRPGYPHAHNNVGIILARTDPGAALTQYGAAIAADPSYHQAYLNRAVLRLSTGDLDGASSDAEHAARLKPEDPAVLALLARTMTEQGRLPEALSVADEVLRLAPGHSDAWFARGKILYRMERPEEAVVAFRNALGANPDLIQAHNNLAIILTRMGRDEEARRELDRFIQLGGTPHPGLVRALSTPDP